MRKTLEPENPAECTMGSEHQGKRTMIMTHEERLEKQVEKCSERVDKMRSECRAADDLRYFLQWIARGSRTCR
jgi:hypothetical protein